MKKILENWIFMMFFISVVRRIINITVNLYQEMQ